MFVNQSFFDEDDEDANQRNEGISHNVNHDPGNGANAKQKLEERRKLFNRGNRPRSARGRPRVQKHDKFV